MVKIFESIDARPYNFSLLSYGRLIRTVIDMSDHLRMQANPNSRLPTPHPIGVVAALTRQAVTGRPNSWSGQYDDPEDFKKLHAAMNEVEGGRPGMRVFYLSIPPSIFVPVAQNAAQHVSAERGETRVIVEKPFGRDLESSRQLTKSLAEDLSVGRCKSYP